MDCLSSCDLVLAVTADARGNRSTLPASMVSERGALHSSRTFITWRSWCARCYEREARRCGAAGIDHARHAALLRDGGKGEKWQRIYTAAAMAASSISDRDGVRDDQRLRTPQNKEYAGMMLRALKEHVAKIGGALPYDKSRSLSGDPVNPDGPRTETQR